MQTEQEKILKQMTPSQRLAASRSLYLAAVRLTESAIRKWNPEMNEVQIATLVRKRFLNARS